MKLDKTLARFYVAGLVLFCSSAALAQTSLPTGSASAVESPAPGPEPVVAPKKPGVIRIGIALPKAQLGQAGAMSGGPEVLRALETQYLRGPAVDIVSLSAMIPIQIAAELKDKDCDYALYSTLVEKPAGSGNSLLRRAAPLANMIPIASVVRSTTGAVLTSATSVALASAGELTSGLKAKSEMSFSYRLVAIANGAESSVLEDNLKAKAKQDGDDIVTPMLEQAATAVISKVSHTQPRAQAPAPSSPAQVAASVK